MTFNFLFIFFQESFWFSGLPNSICFRDHRLNKGKKKQAGKPGLP